RRPLPRRSRRQPRTSRSAGVARTARARPSERRTDRLVITVAIRGIENGIVGRSIGTIIPCPFHLFRNPPDWRGFSSDAMPRRVAVRGRFHGQREGNERRHPESFESPECRGSHRSIGRPPNRPPLDASRQQARGASAAGREETFLLERAKKECRAFQERAEKASNRTCWAKCAIESLEEMMGPADPERFAEGAASELEESLHEATRQLALGDAEGATKVASE